MNAFIILFIGLFFATFIGAADTDQKDSIEQRLERVINGLLPQTPFENQYGAPASLKNRMAYYYTPGVSIAVIKDYKIEWARGFGVREHTKPTPITQNTLFQAASISKPVFATAVMRLVQEGRLNLDEDINTYLMNWKVPKNGEWQPRITLRQLLSHTAGLSQPSFPGYLRSQKLPTVLDILNGQQPANTQQVVVNILPGIQMRYSGGGTMVAQQLVTDVLKKPFADIMDEIVLTPLGLKNSTYQHPLPKQHEKMAATGHYQNNIPINGKWYVYPETAAAGMWTTPSDLAKFGLELQRAFKGSSKFLTKESFTQMAMPGVSENMGLGFFLAGHGENTRFFHTGSNEGFKADAVFYKNLGLGAVIMINSNSGELMFEIERAIAKEYAWPGYFADEKKQITLSKGILKSLQGSYLAKGNAKYEIAIADDKIYLKLDGQPALELIPQSSTQFFIRSLNSTITIDKGEMTILQNGNETKAKK